MGEPGLFFCCGLLKKSSVSAVCWVKKAPKVLVEALMANIRQTLLHLLVSKTSLRRADGNQPASNKFNREAEYRNFATLKPLTALDTFETSLDGLSPVQVEKRIGKFGLNEVYGQVKGSIFHLALSYFKNPFILLLCFLDSISLATQDWGGVFVISLMICLSIVLSYFQEKRSEKAVKKLQSLVTNKIFVTRQLEVADKGGSEQWQPQKFELPFHALVPGDIIHLAAGDMVPADCKIISAKDLFISQASLTGEGLPVEKFAKIETEADFSMLLSNNLCFMGTSVISGSAIAVIIGTGWNTYFGSLAQVLIKPKPKTAFDQSLTKYAWLVISFMFVLVPTVFLINGTLKGDWLEAFLFAIAVAVGLTSEMLPMIVAVNLSRGAIAMAKKKVIMKKLPAIQNFGSMDVLCTDKTGTLTQDKVVLEKYIDVFGENSDHVLLYAYLNSYHQTGLNNLLDHAVLDHKKEVIKFKVDEHFRKVDEIPFDFVRRRMSVVVEQSKTENLLICKGALEEILLVSKFYKQGDQCLPIDAEKHSEFKRLANEMNMDGLRVIAVAYKNMLTKDWQYSQADESELVLVGFVAFLDPPKESAREAIHMLYEYGVQVKVLTGDNEFVTRKICQQVGIPTDKILLGSDVEKLNDPELATIAETCSVFAKLSPFQKERIITALHFNNHVVGYIGDGINDAPAMKKADLSISVENAVDIAKESADVILLERSLLVLAEGVKGGRKVYGNIIKFINIGASSNFGNVFSVVGSSLLLPFLPMLPGQIMLLKILYDIAQTAVPWDEVDIEFMKKPRRWEMREVKRYMLVFGPYSSVFDYITFAVLWFVYGYQTDATQNHFTTGWFIESSLTQVMIYVVLRTRKMPFLQSSPSKIVLIASLLGVTLSLYIPLSIVGPYFGFAPLPLSFYFWLTGICSSYILLGQVLKKLYYRYISFEPVY